MTSARDDHRVHDHIRLATAAIQARNFQSAEASLKQALALSPGHYDALQLLGIVKSLQSKQSEAIPFFLASLDGKENQANVHCNLGRAFVATGAYAPAEKHLQRAI